MTSDLKGIISKKGRIFGHWKDYLFTAEGGHLKYFAIGNERVNTSQLNKILKQKGDIVLSQCTLDLQKSSSGYLYPNSFVITSPSRSYYLCCPSYKEFTEWKQVLLTNGIQCTIPDIIFNYVSNTNDSNDTNACNNNNANTILSTPSKQSPTNCTNYARRTMSTAVQMERPVDPDLGDLNLLPREILLEVLIQLDQFHYFVLMMTCKFFYTYLRPMLSEDFVVFVLIREKKRLEIRKQWGPPHKIHNAPTKKPVDKNPGLWRSRGGKYSDSSTYASLPAPNSNGQTFDQTRITSSIPHVTNPLGTLPPFRNSNNDTVRRIASASVSHPKKSSSMDVLPVVRSKSILVPADYLKQHQVETIEDEHQVTDILTISALCVVGHNKIVTGHHNGMIAFWMYYIERDISILMQKVWADPCPVTALVFDPLHKYLISISTEGSRVYFWNIVTTVPDFCISGSPLITKGPDVATCVCFWNFKPTVGFRNGELITYTVTPDRILVDDRLVCDPVRAKKPTPSTTNKEHYPTSMVYFNKNDQLWVGTNQGMVLVFAEAIHNIPASMEFAFSAYENHPVTSLCCWYSQIACASHKNTLVKILNSQGECSNVLECSNVFLDHQKHWIVSDPNCKSGVIALLRLDTFLWTATRNGFMGWDWAGVKPVQVLQHGPVSAACAQSDRIVFSVGRKCHWLNMYGHAPYNLSHAGESFDHPWMKQRLLWIGKLKNSPEECCLAGLPAEVVAIIFRFVVANE